MELNKWYSLKESPPTEEGYYLYYLMYYGQPHLTLKYLVKDINCELDLELDTFGVCVAYMKADIPHHFGLAVAEESVRTILTGRETVNDHFIAKHLLGEDESEELRDLVHAKFKPERASQISEICGRYGIGVEASKNSESEGVVVNIKP